ncbi:hypothetical protein OG215_38350 (plasmid) [Streptomyces globisporus]|uniref:hypothetical protein n=1 Tax=Streptomyces globisporus TaxID=1908 RepID=UPI002F912DDD|nr:hypothetical protein OG215_38350 [Streptomyces globisporus]
MVHRDSIHPNEEQEFIESKLGETLWRFEYADEDLIEEFMGPAASKEEYEEYTEIHRDPKEVLNEGFTREEISPITIGYHRNLGYTESQYISTTLDPELWFHRRRYRYKIIPAFNWDESSRTGVWIPGDDNEMEVSFTNRIEPQAIVEVYDRILDRTGSIDKIASRLVWRNGGRFDWILENHFPQAQRIAAIVNVVITGPSERHGLHNWRREVCAAVMFYAKMRESNHSQAEMPSDSEFADLAKCIDLKNEIVNNLRFLPGLAIAPLSLVGSCAAHRYFLDAAVDDPNLLHLAGRLPEGPSRENYFFSFQMPHISAPVRSSDRFSPVSLSLATAAATHPVPLSSFPAANNPQMADLEKTNFGAFNLLRNTLTRQR